LQVASDGSLVFDIPIPNGARTGTQYVLVSTDANQDATLSTVNSAGANITITGASLTATPNAVVPNQTVNLQGTGWTDGGAATINAASDASVISLGGATTGLRATGTAAVAAIKEGAIDYLAKPADAEDVEKALLADPSKKAAPPENPMSADRVKWEHIHRVFELCNRNVSETARRLKMHRRTLQRILSKRSPR